MKNLATPASPTPSPTPMSGVGKAAAIGGLILGGMQLLKGRNKGGGKTVRVGNKTIG
jgi:hypothetical protein